MPPPVPIRAILFDKDGTLLDFHRTWDTAIGVGLRAAATTSQELQRAADLLDFDLATDHIRPTSPMIAEPNSVIIDLLSPVCDVARCFEVALRIAIDGAAPAHGLPEALIALRAQGVRLAVVTNDYEDVAHRQLQTLGWTDLFEAVIGSDSGFGAKPGASIVHGALGVLGIERHEAAIVGDTGHDLKSGRAAGVRTILVTNGTSPTAEDRNLADHVLASLHELGPALADAALLTDHGTGTAGS